MKRAEIPNAQQYKAMLDWLKARGLPAALITSALGNSPQGRTQLEITERLRLVLRNLPARGAK